MQEIETCQLKMNRKPVLPTLLLAVVCAFSVILFRISSASSLIKISGVWFPFTDIFMIAAAAVGGLGCGLLSFVLVFIGEFLSVGGDISIYTVSTYLVLGLVSSWLSYRGWFRGLLRTASSCVVLTSALSFCWLMTFTVIVPETLDSFRRNAFSGLSFGPLFLRALPEILLTVVIVSLYFRYAPEKIRLALGSGWVYVCPEEWNHRRWPLMAIRMTSLSLAEAVILCVSAIFCIDYFSSASGGETFGIPYLLSMWRENLQLGLTMICAAVPTAYLFNFAIMKYVVFPINSMSFFMNRYFSVSEQERTRALPDLNIHTGDELEELYHSLQKMVADMTDHIDARIEQERRSARLTREFMLALAKAVDAKDHYTSGHSVRVAKYAKEIARRMGKSPREQEDIYTMGLLHDIGKIGIPNAIINKNGKLTDDEYQKIREHPVMGYDILKYVEELPTLANGAKWHHERYDGRGYPDGLAGTDIPEEARIIAVADTYDALTSNRAYSSIRPQSDVRSEIIRCKGTQFDPEIADIMVQMIDEDTDYKMHEFTHRRQAESNKQC